ncbi:MAG: acyl carrier protein [Gammaproteobacteria bacterium]
MDKAEILQRVQRVIAESLDIDLITAQPHMRIKEDLAVDSMQLITIVIALDEEFDAEFNTDSLPREAVTVQWVADYVAHTLGQNS